MQNLRIITALAAVASAAALSCNVRSRMAFTMRFLSFDRPASHQFLVVVSRPARTGRLRCPVLGLRQLVCGVQHDYTDGVRLELRHVHVVRG